MSSKTLVPPRLGILFQDYTSPPSSSAIPFDRFPRSVMEFLDGDLVDRVWSLAWNPVDVGVPGMLASCSGDKIVRIWQKGPSRSWDRSVCVPIYNSSPLFASMVYWMFRISVLWEGNENCYRLLTLLWSWNLRGSDLKLFVLELIYLLCHNYLMCVVTISLLWFKHGLCKSSANQICHRSS